jgi:hypothetical protein
MTPIIFISFGIWCLLSILSTAPAAVLLFHFFSLEQLLQSSSGIFRDSAFGNQLVNYIVTLVVVSSASVSLIKNKNRISVLFSPFNAFILILYIWTFISCIWSPGGNKGIYILLAALPYLVLFYLFLPILITSLDEWRVAANLSLILGTIITCLILISPEFTMKFGRLGLDMATAEVGGRTNPLSIGELGGTCVLLGAILGQGTKFSLFTLVRIIGIISGTILAVKSGSRGQILFSIITIGVVYPISKPLKDIKNYIFVFLGLLFILLLVTTLSGFIAESGSYDMQKRWIEGGTDSGVGIRMANITFLLETYITSPAYWVQGLGFYSFAVLNPLNEPYTHAIIVDMIGEQGLIGAILFFGILFFLVKSCYSFFKLVQYNAKLRENFASIFAMLIYEILLANKQGNISGAFAFFGFSILIVSLYKNEMFMQINSSLISDE